MITEMLADNTIGVPLFFLIGTIFGSFATMICHRLPLGKDLIFKRSHCTNCNHVLGIKDLFPIFSWLFSGGKCRYCKTKIHIKYLLIELSLGCVFALIYYKIGLNLKALPIFGLALTLIIMIVIDFEYKIIPDSLQIILIPLGILFWYTSDRPASLLLWGPLVGFSIAFGLRWGFWIWKKKEGLGMGDVKFFTVGGLFLGVKAFVPFMLISGIIGVITGLIWQKLGKGKEFPFGPALAVTLFLCVVFPEYIVEILYF